MAIALTNVVRHNVGDLNTIHATLTYSSTYSASATITAAQLGLTRIDAVLAAGSNAGNVLNPVINTYPSGVSFIPHLFTATGSEASGTVADVVQIVVFGK